jgi:hypothetical protein
MDSTKSTSLADEPDRSRWERSERGRSARIGTLAMFMLLAVIGLSLLAVLSVVTASASASLSERQATSVREQYAAEAAAQSFVAGMDEIAQSSTDTSAEGRAASVESQLDELNQRAESAASDQSTQVTSSVEGNVVNASFTCENGSVLDVVISINSDGTYRIEQWKMSAVSDETQEETLLSDSSN